MENIHSGNRQNAFCTVNQDLRNLISLSIVFATCNAANLIVLLDTKIMSDASDDWVDPSTTMQTGDDGTGTLGIIGDVQQEATRRKGEKQFVNDANGTKYKLTNDSLMGNRLQPKKIVAMYTKDMLIMAVICFAVGVYTFVTLIFFVFVNNQ